MKASFLLCLLVPVLLATEAPAPPASIEEKEKKETVTIDGQEISYKVKASFLTLKDEKGKDRASLFHVTYLRMGVADRPKRPVTFCFNGGPGSSAVWLHLGGVGPRLVPTTPDGTATLPPPAVLQPNPFSILDVSDLVFIDPVSTGFSRPEGDTKKSEFHGVEEDITSVGDFIRRWTSENDRWSSPKYLLGESYGGIRAAGLAQHLQDRYGMNLNGVILLSSLLDFRTLRSGPGDDLSHAVFLPAFTATARYHNKIEGEMATLHEEARAFAFGDYTRVLLQGHEASAEDRERVAATLQTLTSLPAAFWLENHLRISPARFRRELLREQQLTLGRFDSRVAWPAISPQDDYPDYDPSYRVAYGAFATAINDYLSRELDWKGHHPYEILTSKVHPWNWGRKNSILNVTDKLATSLRDNPDLRILVMAGYTDLATPPTGILQSLRTTRQIPESYRGNITTAWYQAGHMFYLNQPDLEKMRADLVNFIR